MVAVTLPLAGSSSSSGGSTADYTTIIDGSLDLYNAIVKNYPVADAFVTGGDTSQEFWGLQSVSTGRTAQNTAWKALLSYGIEQTSGIDELSLNSILPSTRNIKSILSGNVKYGIYSDGFFSYKQNFSILANYYFSVKMSTNGVYVFMTNSIEIIRYTLSTPGDITTAGSRISSPTLTSHIGFDITPDGSKVVVIKQVSPYEFIEYEFGTNFDVTTINTTPAYTKTSSLSSSGYGIRRAKSGDELWTLEPGTSNWSRYTTTTPYSISGITTTASETRSLSGIGATIGWFDISSDGKSIVLTSSNTDTLYILESSLAFDFTNASLTNSISISSEESTAQGVCLYSKNLYISGASNKIYQYSGDVELEVDIIVNGSVYDNFNISTVYGDFYAGDVVFLNFDISSSQINIEINVKNIINPNNDGIKLGFGLTGGTYTTPTGNYETSQLDLLF